MMTRRGSSSPRCCTTGIGARHLVCGPDFAFGHRRGGDTAFLAARAEALGIGLTVVTPLGDEAGPISSSRIRRALQDGYPERAAAQARAATGRSAAPCCTATRAGAPSAFRPPTSRSAGIWSRRAGVYAVTVRLPDGRRLRGVANVGRRPTVSAGPESRLEVNLFDFEGDLYGEELEVSLHAFLRPEAQVRRVGRVAGADRRRRRRGPPHP